MDMMPDARQGESIPPPGWVPSPRHRPAVIAAADDLSSEPADEAADAAVRWRISAAILDNLLVYGGYLLLCWALHWRIANPRHLPVYLVMLVGYHVLLESRAGQTLGKSRYGVRVVAADGSRATFQAVALRSILRIIDQLPVLYVSGLVSMVRTGPRRRQRIGDVAGRTLVIPVEPSATLPRTPRWMLPAATLIAVLASVVSVYAATERGKQPLSTTEQAQFVAGCERTPGATVVDCRCLLTNLEAAGYTTLRSLLGLYTQVRTAVISRNPAALPPALVAATRSCRR